MESLIFAFHFVVCLATGAAAGFLWSALLIGLRKWAEDRRGDGAYAVALVIVLVLAFGTSIASVSALHWLFAASPATVQPE